MPAPGLGCTFAWCCVLRPSVEATLNNSLRSSTLFGNAKNAVGEDDVDATAAGGSSNASPESVCWLWSSSNGFSSKCEILLISFYNQPKN